MTSVSYPDGRVVQNGFDALNRLLVVANRQWGSQAAGSTYWYAPSYAPPGELTAATLGNGMQVQASYSSRQSISALAYLKQSCSPVFSKVYTWDKNGSNLSLESDQITGLNRQFGYDNLNRLESAMDVMSNGTGQVPTGGLNQTYVLDNWGNLTQMGSNGFSQYINNQNQVGIYGYDAAGRLKNDLLTQYTYDSDGMMLSSSDGTSYSYDGAGQRASVVRGGAETDFYYFGGRLYATNSPTGWTDMIYAGEQRIATVPGTQTATPVYALSDHIGSEVATADSTGTVLSAMDYTPFGQLLTQGNTNGFSFTGLVRDNDLLDHAGFRQYSSSTGRWTTPDPYDGSYSISNPQSLNRYAYVGNSPLSGVDPTGLDCNTLTVIGAEDDTPPAPCESGWWDTVLGWFGIGGSGFHGNKAALSAGKSVYKPAGSATPDHWNNEYSRQLFQGPAAGNFIAANTAVNDAGIAAGAAYGGAIFAPEIVAGFAEAGTMLNEATFGPAEGRLFWSGYNQGAMSLAEESGLGRTIGQTFGGRAIMTLFGPNVNSIWAIASHFWAVGASGAVTAFILNEGAVWTGIELPALQANPNVTNIIILP